MLHPSWLTGVAGRVADPEGDVAGVAGSAARGGVSSTTTTGPAELSDQHLVLLDTQLGARSFSRDHLAAGEDGPGRKHGRARSEFLWNDWLSWQLGI